MMTATILYLMVGVGIFIGIVAYDRSHPHEPIQTVDFILAFFAFMWFWPILLGYFMQEHSRGRSP